MDDAQGAWGGGFHVSKSGCAFTQQYKVKVELNVISNNCYYCY